MPSRVLLWACAVVLILFTMKGGILQYVRSGKAPVKSTPSFVQEEPAPTETISQPVVLMPSVAIVPSSTQPITLRFVGDVMLDRNVKIRSEKAGSRAYPFDMIRPWLKDADYTIANLEGPVTDRRRAPEKSIDFLFDPVVLPVLQEAGFDAFSQANNHALDQGAPGYADSIRRVREAGFLTFGHQVEDGTIALATTTVRGTRFAFLGWNTTDNPLDRTSAREAIKTARREADQVIAYLHWGPEYRNTPHQNEVNTAHWLIDEGVDVVIGGHPHWTQGVSAYKGKPILWSLGNFVFDQDFSLETQQGLGVTLAYTSSTLSVSLDPIRIPNSQPTLEQGEAKKARLRDLADVSVPLLREAILAGVIEFAL